MTKMVITHNVADVDIWLKFKSERAGAVGLMGGSEVVDFVAEDGNNAVAIGFDAEDAETVTAIYASPPPEFAEVMERHGVLPPVTVYVEG